MDNKNIVYIFALVGGMQGRAMASKQAGIPAEQSLSMDKPRIIQVSKTELAKARKDRERFLGLAFALMIKAEFVNSIFIPHNKRYICSFLHIGMPKYKEAVRCAVKYGYCRVNTDGSVEALKIRSERRTDNIPVEVGDIRPDRLNGAASTLKENEVRIEEAILLNHICQVQTIEDTKDNLRARHADDTDAKGNNPRTKEYRAAVKFNERVMSPRGKDLYDMTSEEGATNPEYSNKGISIMAFKEYTHRSHVTVIKRLKSLKAKGKITVMSVLLPVMVAGAVWSMRNANAYNNTEETGGYLRRVKGDRTVYMQVSNVYRIVKD